MDGLLLFHLLFAATFFIGGIVGCALGSIATKILNKFDDERNY